MKDYEEVRVTSSTGGQKGSKPLRYDLIPTGALAELAEHYGKGAAKYDQVNGRDNWRNGYEWSLSFAALQRHANAFWAGENIDRETGSAHLTAVAWHAFTLLEFMREYPELDDRQDPLYDEPEPEPLPEPVYPCFGCSGPAELGRSHCAKCDPPAPLGTLDNPATEAKVAAFEASLYPPAAVLVEDVRYGRLERVEGPSMVDTKGSAGIGGKWSRRRAGE